MDRTGTYKKYLYTSLSTLRFSTLFTMILQCFKIIVRDAGLEPGPLPQKSCAQAMSHQISTK